MKKTLLIGTLALIISPFFLSNQPASAACGYGFFVGVNAENVNGCTGLPEGQHIDGFTIDIENNKITLKNYNGGAIHYFCRATCASVKPMKIELIGENTINSQSSNTYLNEHDVPQNAAFINIIPTFVGSGTLKIESGQPIAFEGNRNSDTFSIDVIGADFEKTIIEPIVNEEEPVVTTVNTSENNSNNSPNSSSESFFETALGIALLIAVPSTLIIIIVILLVALINKKNPATPTSVTNQPGNNNQ